MKTAKGKEGLESQDEGEEEEVSEYETESEQEQDKDSKGNKGGKNLSSGKAGVIWRRFRLKFNKKEARSKLDKIKQGMQKENKIQKYLIIGFATVAAIFYFSISVYWMARADSANRYDSDAELLQASNQDVHLFD